MVTNAMKKVKISEGKCLVIVGVVMFLYGIVMAIHQGIGEIQVSEVIIVKDQFDYEKQPKCLYGNDDAYIAVNIFVLLSILFAARMLWVTRKVASTISSTATTATGKQYHAMSHRTTSYFITITTTMFPIT